MKVVVIDGEIELLNVVDGDAVLLDVIDGEGVPVIEAKNYDYYSGSYSITPTETAQTIPTTDKMSAQDFTIEAIPNNYGRILWDGTRLLIY